MFNCEREIFHLTDALVLFVDLPLRLDEVVTRGTDLRGRDDLAFCQVLHLCELSFTPVQNLRPGLKGLLGGLQVPPAPTQCFLGETDLGQRHFLLVGLEVLNVVRVGLVQFPFASEIVDMSQGRPRIDKMGGFLLAGHLRRLQQSLRDAPGIGQLLSLGLLEVQFFGDRSKVYPGLGALQGQNGIAFLDQITGGHMDLRNDSRLARLDGDVLALRDDQPFRIDLYVDLGEVGDRSRNHDHRYETIERAPHDDRRNGLNDLRPFIF